MPRCICRPTDSHTLVCSDGSLAEKQATTVMEIHPAAARKSEEMKMLVVASFRIEPAYIALHITLHAHQPPFGDAKQGNTWLGSIQVISFGLGRSLVL